MKVLQNIDELAKFVELLRGENVTRYLEIGAKHGGSLRAVGMALPPSSRLVCVDLPFGTIKRAKSQPDLLSVQDELQKAGHEVHVIWGDSTDGHVVEQVRKFAPYDAVLIDANHTLPYVTQDWQNYGPMARIVAFHDIAWKRDKWDPAIDYHPIEVPKLWNAIKQEHRHVEIELDGGGRDNGIGVVWRD